MKCPICNAELQDDSLWDPKRNKGVLRLSCPQCTFSLHDDVDEPPEEIVKRLRVVERKPKVQLSEDYWYDTADFLRELSGLGMYWIEYARDYDCSWANSMGNIRDATDVTSESDAWKYAENYLEQPVVDVFPMRAIDHSGLWITGTGYGGYPDARWDGVLLGFVVITAEFFYKWVRLTYGENDPVVKRVGRAYERFKKCQERKDPASCRRRWIRRLRELYEGDLENRIYKEILEAFKFWASGYGLIVEVEVEAVLEDSKTGKRYEVVGILEHFGELVHVDTPIRELVASTVKEVYEQYGHHFSEGELEEAVS